MQQNLSLSQLNYQQNLVTLTQNGIDLRLSISEEVLCWGNVLALTGMALLLLTLLQAYMCPVKPC